MDEFIKLIKEELEIVSAISENTSFKDLDEWDSMCALILSAFLENKYKVEIKPNDFEYYNTFKDLYNMIKQ